MRCYTQKYGFPSKTAKGNQKKKNAVLKCKKKRFLFEKIDKNVQINSLFLGNSENFYLCPRNPGDFFIWRSVLFTVSALEMCERETYS